jgi:RNA recognition motif-containing protein
MEENPAVINFKRAKRKNKGGNFVDFEEDKDLLKACTALDKMERQRGELFQDKINEIIKKTEKSSTGRKKRIQNNERQSGNSKNRIYRAFHFFGFQTICIKSRLLSLLLKLLKFRRPAAAS